MGAGNLSVPALSCIPCCWVCLLFSYTVKFSDLESKDVQMRWDTEHSSSCAALICYAKSFLLKRRSHFHTGRLFPALFLSHWEPLLYDVFPLRCTGVLQSASLVPVEQLPVMCPLVSGCRNAELRCLMAPTSSRSFLLHGNLEKESSARASHQQFYSVLSRMSRTGFGYVVPGFHTCAKWFTWTILFNIQDNTGALCYLCPFYAYPAQGS